FGFLLQALVVPKTRISLRPQPLDGPEYGPDNHGAARVRFQHGLPALRNSANKWLPQRAPCKKVPRKVKEGPHEDRVVHNLSCLKAVASSFKLTEDHLTG